MEKRARQRIHYLRTPDSVRLAWADAGEGPLLIKAANWLTHLEYEWESPVWRHWLRFFCDRFRFVRYDERGCGMTEWSVGELSVERSLEELEQVVAAVEPREPFALLGVSQGAATCIAYAVKYPERVSRLVLYGGYARGWSRRDLPERAREYEAIAELVGAGWGRDNPTFRQLFTSRFIPGATTEQMDWFNDLCRKTTTAEIAARLLRARAEIDVVQQLAKIRAPTLVLHARDDIVVPIAEGRILASGIAGAEFVELDSKNHILLENEPAWGRFCEALVEFAGVGPRTVGEDRAFGALTARERAILTLLTQGLGNAAIAEQLHLSEKTVRNHVSNVFDKLGVWTRAQAIVFARDRGFRG